MYRYSQQVRQNMTNTRVKIRILTVLLIIAVVMCMFFGVRYFKLGARNAHTHQQLIQRVRSICTDAKAFADKIPNSVQSATAVQLANVQKCVYAIEKLNDLSVALYGEDGRIVPAVSIEALYTDLNTCFGKVQRAGENLASDLQLLRNHLAALQTILLQDGDV